MQRFTRIAGALALVIAIPIAATVMAARPFTDPIIGSAHGSTYGPDGKQIDVTAEFIARAQQVYLSHVLDGATAAQRASYLSKRSYLDAVALGAASPGDKQSALVARSLLLDWLIGEVQPTDAKLLKQRNAMLKSWLQQGVGYTDGTPYLMQPHEEAMLAQIGVPAPALVAAGTPPSDEVLQAREAYAKKCRKAGVPLPPTWGASGPTGWTRVGRLERTEVFIENDKVADVYQSQSASPQGVCLALPRFKDMPADAPNELLGIICMGTGIVDPATGAPVASACFWDNQKDGAAVPIPRTGLFPINTNFAAGEELDGGSGGTCTKCHAGENAFIVHPDAAAFAGISNLEPKAYYKPIVATSWPQNSGPNTTLVGVAVPAGEKSCLNCHRAGDKRRLPQIVKEIATPFPVNYCDSVMKQAIARTMPEGGTVFPDPKYKTHTDFLIKACDDAAAGP